MSEWLDLMLDEISRKKRAAREALDEIKRREDADKEDAVEAAPPQSK